MSVSEKETENELNTLELSVTLSSSFGARRHVPNSARETCKEERKNTVSLVITESVACILSPVQ